MHGNDVHVILCSYHLPDFLKELLERWVNYAIYVAYHEGFFCKLCHFYILLMYHNIIENVIFVFQIALPLIALSAVGCFVFANGFKELRDR